MKIVFIDLDGTFLNEKKKIPPLNLYVLNELYKQGIQVVPTTGRSLTGLPKELMSHPCVNYAICSNGAVIYDLKENLVLNETSLEKQIVSDLYEQLKSFDIQFDVFADNQIFSERSRLERLHEFQLDEATYCYVMSVRVPIDESMPKFIETCTRIERTNFFYKSIEDKEAIIELIQTNSSLICLSSLPTNLEVMNKQAHKGNAVLWLLNHLKMNRFDAIAFGDSNNDVTMLEVVLDGVAMKNACQECQEVANHCCMSNDEAGVARYLMNLLEERNHGKMESGR